jgi:hypothetical protein
MIPADHSILPILICQALEMKILHENAGLVADSVILPTGTS